MRIYEFTSGNRNDLLDAVAEDVNSPEQKLRVRSDHFGPCLVAGRKRIEDAKKETAQHTRTGLWHYGWSMIAVIVGLVISVPPVMAGPAADQLKQSVEKVQATLSDKNLKSPAKAEERRQQLRDLISSRFDFEEMAKRSLGPEWQKHTPEEQQQFVTAFTRVLENGYFDTLESYNGEKVRFVGRDRAYHGVGFGGKDHPQTSPPLF
jgi:hypothetical protein